MGVPDVHQYDSTERPQREETPATERSAAPRKENFIKRWLRQINEALDAVLKFD